MIKRFFLTLLLMCNVLVSEDYYNIASYPRSANTWVRYCIEYLLKCPTIGPGGGFYAGTLPYGSFADMLETVDREFNLPLDYTLSLGVKEGNPFFLKLHKIEQIENLSGPLILIIRNYKECIPSQLLRSNMEATYQTLVQSIEDREYFYFTNIQVFDAYKGRKLLIYYEDLMDRPKETLQKILDFSGLPYGDLDRFISELSLHKEKVIEYYSSVGYFDSVTRGEDQEYFQTKLTPEERRDLDHFIKDSYPLITDFYLSRYFEVL